MAKLPKYEASEGNVIVVGGHNSWGSGKTSTEAFQNWRRNIPRFLGHGKKEVMILEVTPPFQVDQFGTITAKKLTKLEERTIPR